MEFLNKVSQKIKKGFRWLVEFCDADKTYAFCALFVLVVVIVCWGILRFIDYYWCKWGYSLAVGWYLGRGFISPIAKRIKRLVNSALRDGYWKWRLWRERREDGGR